MRELSDNLIEAANELAQPDPWFVLLDVTLPDATVFRIVNNNEDVTFEGNVYTAANFILDPPKTNSTGEIQPIQLQVCNINQALTALMEANVGGVGATVRLTVINAGLLAETYTELQMDFDVISASMNNKWVTFKLGAPNLLLSRFPQFRYIASRCRWLRGYAVWPECGYVGSLPTCKGTLDDCRAHGNSRRFGGHAGLAPGGVRVV